MPSHLIPLDKGRADAARRASNAKVATVTPELLGLPLFQARWFAGLAALSLSVTRATAAGPAGHVVAQDPVAGEPSTRGGLVHIVVSNVEQALTDGREG
jgi:beta-lactam-binding protein with PASTA domain